MKRLFFLIFALLFCGSLSFTRSMDYKGLFADLKKYKKIRGECHAGHLYEHMVWVAKSMDKLFEDNSLWVKGFDERDRRLMVIAAFMHDIGKAGDLEYNYLVKPSHPRDGFEYLMGKKPYKLNKAGKRYNFNAWCKRMHIYNQDRATLAVLIGMHQEFGVMLGRIKRNPRAVISLLDAFINTLEKYTYEANYNGGLPDERIARMSIAMSRADLEGMFPVEHPIKQAPELKDHPQTLDAVPLVSIELIDFIGYPLAQFLIKRFQKRSYLYSQDAFAAHA